jgi:hypothetical protein
VQEEFGIEKKIKMCFIKQGKKGNDSKQNGQ